MKLITVLNRSYVLTSRGKCLGPIYPFLESRDHIIAMINRGLLVYEIIDGNKGVRLTLDNVDKDNSDSTHDVVFVNSVSLNKKNLELVVGNSEKLLVTILPEDATNRDVTWSTTAQSVATVDNGLVVAKSKGQATIKVSSNDTNKYDECLVIVNEPFIKLDKITLDRNDVTLIEGESTTLTYKLSPENPTNKEVIWSSDNDQVAKVDDGVVTAVAQGATKIKLTSQDGTVSAECNVNVNPKIIEVEAITLTPNSLDMTIGDEEVLVHTFTPEEPTNKEVIWSSDNDQVAEVDNGVVTAKLAGSANITISSGNGKVTAKCTVTVTEPSVEQPAE